MKRDPAWRIAACPVCGVLCRVHLTKQPVQVGKKIRMRWLPEYLVGNRVHSCGTLKLEKKKFISAESFEKKKPKTDQDDSALGEALIDFASDADPEDDFQHYRQRYLRPFPGCDE